MSEPTVLMLAVSAASFGIVASFITTAGLGIAALIRGSRGDTALKEATNATALWTQTTALIDQLQEENIRHQEMITACERKCVECGVTSDLLKAKLDALLAEYSRSTVKIELLEAQVLRLEKS